jgi:thiol:disulfide interchange protein DsbC
MNIRIAVFVLLMSMVAQPSMADSVASTIEQIRGRILAAQPGLPISTLSESEFPGLYEVELRGGQKIYTSKTGDYLLAGELYKVTGQGLVNLTQQAKNEIRVSKISAIDESQMIVFSPENRKATITVFTDTDCGYCRKLHRDVPTLNEMGIAVRYLAFPRAGAGSKTYQKMVSAWCAEDKLDAMNKLKSGIPIPVKTCVNPIEEQHQLGQQLGVNGTPALVLENGRLVPGYLEPQQMAMAVGLN